MNFFHTGGGAAARGRARRSQRGASMLEGMIALCFMCFVFFALLQVYQWCATRIFARYSAYYGAKGRALGYKTNIMLRAARVAALPVSGPAAGRRGRSEHDDASDYMQNGDASGVWYRYWYPQNGEDAELRLRGHHEGDNIFVTVKLANAPLISPVLGKVLCLEENPEPAGTSCFYDHSSVFLEE
ncbi:MAG: hypothetical protein IJU70_09805 [Lentisphaeria bacterium]|nr:hypothetical protein [Lentisphaeria bacterium]